MNEELNPAPLPNGAAPLGDIPVHGTEPVAPKKRRKRKAKPAAPRVARTRKVKPIDPIKAAAQLSSVSPAASDARADEAPAPSIVQGVGADHFVEARERVLEKQFRADVRALVSPPIKSTWGQRFVFGLRRMTGIDGDAEPVRFSTTLTILFCFALVGALAGVARAVL